jgi:hypothetical protein
MTRSVSYPFARTFTSYDLAPGVPVPEDTFEDDDFFGYGDEEYDFYDDADDEYLDEEDYDPYDDEYGYDDFYGEDD